MRTTPLLLLVLACGGPPPSDKKPDTDLTGTQSLLVSAVVEEADPAAPLSRYLRVELTAPAELRVTWNGVETVWPAAARHDAILAGFHPDTETALQVEVVAEDRTETLDDLVVTTPPLPSYLPSFDVRFQDKSRQQPGMTLVNLETGPGESFSDEDWVLILDEDAVPIFAWVQTSTVNDVVLTPDGTLIMTDGGGLREIDLAGVDVRAWQPTDWGTDGMFLAWTREGLHHEVDTLSDGGIFTMGIERTFVSGYPTDYDDPTITSDGEVTDDTVVVFEPDGTLRWRWAMSEVLDTHRIGYDSLGKRRFVELPDWAHANAAFYDEDSGALIVSIRHQDAVVRIDAATGALVWILGNHDNWSAEYAPFLLDPVGPLNWQYHQHAASIGPNGDILLFDNGNGRASPHTQQIPVDDADNASRIVSYAVDEATMEVSQNWEYAANALSGPLFSGTKGDADYLDNGNVLGCFARITYQNHVSNESLGLGKHSVRLVEIIPGPNPETVWDLAIETQLDDQPNGWSAYRAERLATLYPQLR